jgi:hypothetical protein
MAMSQAFPTPAAGKNRAPDTRACKTGNRLRPLRVHSVPQRLSRAR